MNKQITFARVAAIALLAGASAIASAQPASTGYVGSTSGDVVKNPFGLCWHTGFFAPADAIAGCDDDLIPKKAAPTPPPPPAPAPAPAPKPAPKPAPAPTSEKVTFAADTFFDFDKAVVKPAGKAKLDDLVSKLHDIKLEVIIAVGHTDSIGTAAYNMKLSVRRAEAVKAYLVHKGIPANRVYTEGKGESQPIASNRTREGRAKNRRVEIEVVGTRQRQ